MPYLFNEDKSLINLGDTSVLIWQGDKQPTDGIEIALGDYGFDPSKYRYLLLVAGTSVNDVEHTILIPAGEDFSGALTDSTYYYYTVDNAITYVVDYYVRTIFYRVTTRVFKIYECLQRHELTDNTYNDVTYQFANSKLIPYEIWGII